MCDQGWIDGRSRRGTVGGLANWPAGTRGLQSQLVPGMAGAAIMSKRHSEQVARGNGVALCFGYSMKCLTESMTWRWEAIEGNGSYAARIRIRDWGVAGQWRQAAAERIMIHAWRWEAIEGKGSSVWKVLNFWCRSIAIVFRYNKVVGVHISLLLLYYTTVSVVHIPINHCLHSDPCTEDPDPRLRGLLDSDGEQLRVDGSMCIGDAMALWQRARVALLVWPAVSNSPCSRADRSTKCFTSQEPNEG